MLSEIPHDDKFDHPAEFQTALDCSSLVNNNNNNNNGGVLERPFINEP